MSVRFEQVSEVLPAVLESEMSIDVFKWSRVLMSVRVHVDLGPFDSVINVWEECTPLSQFLKGHSGAVVVPRRMLWGESSMGNVRVIRCPITKSEVTSLTAEFPLVSEVLDNASFLSVVELLVQILLNPLF